MYNQSCFINHNRSKFSRLQDIISFYSQHADYFIADPVHITAAINIHISDTPFIRLR
jgi:hypothetical protein